MSDDVTDEPLVLADRYELGGLIGRGGMAEVHVGRDTRLSRTVAVKMLRADLARDPSFLTRFRREAQSSAGLNHPAIVSVYDTGEHVEAAGTPGERRIPFIVMEYVEGHTVRDLLGDGDPVPISEAVDIVVGVLNALEYSHREGIVHRDIKPGNIMITPTGDVKVMDFGIARALSDNSATMTQPHSVVGTAQYLSPEQARGEVVDTRSDLYSTGCLLFELLTGRPPFSGDSAVAVAYQHVRETPPTPSSIASDIPENLDRVVMQSLAKNRDERYADAAHFRSDLLAASRGSEVSAPPTTAWAAAGAGAAAAAAAGSATRVVPKASVPAAAPGAGDPEPYRRTPQPVEDEPKRSWAWLWILLAALLVVGGVVTYLLVTGDGRGDEETTPAVTTVDVPELEGLDEAAITAELDEAELVPNFLDPESSDDVEEGLFLSSTPEPGTSVETGSSVDVVLSSGPAEVTVPDLEGMDRAEIVDELEEVELEATFGEPENDDTIEEDLFLRSTPAPGESAPRGSSVEIILSAGPGDVLVPDVAGRSQEEARQILQDAGLSVGNTNTVDEPGAGADQALRTDPATGTSVPRDTEVTLFLASGNVDLQDLTGLPREEAESILDSLELSSNFTEEFSDDVPEGDVITQSHSGLIPQDTRVDVTISRGPEETEEPTTTEPPPEPPTDGD
ncbi:Stk1 family PASTA domain-containing Ser/Thr kinase [Georgenia sp. Z1491]|uniref:Stk1 family PASTA domain-containing Ser/Thr kinase n=1 Tax=Georgenia sp. Z1491 TaxID=3416707 RepID=UPI003CEE53D0